MYKRLLSLLLVLSMTLIMLPVLQPAAAAASTEMAGIRFPSDTESYEAECAVCKKTVTWKPYNGENYSDDCPLTASSTSAHFHLYLTQDQVYEAGKYFLVAYRNVCFNLNGYDITGSVGSSPAFAGARKMNFIDTYGGSVITGCRNVANSGAAINANSVNADYHLYGGTWTVAAEDTLSPVIRLSTKGGIISLHDGAVIDASSRTGSAVTLSGSVTSAGKVQSAVFNVYGGEIKGDVIAGVPGENTADCAALNMLGGVLDGNVYLDNGAAFNDGGGRIAGSVMAAPGMEVALSGKTELQGGLTPADGVAIVDDAGKMVVYATADEAVAAYSAENGFANGSVLKAGTADQTITLSADAYVDAEGKTVTVNGTGKLYGMDSGNDDYKVCAQWNLGEDVIVQSDVVSPINGYRYIFAEGGYHRIDLSITQVALRTTGEPGMYYKACIGCDETLAKTVTGYGTALSVKCMPGTDYAEREDVKYTSFSKEDFLALYADNRVLTNSCMLTGILKTDNSKGSNTVNARSKVYANLYLNMTLDGAAVTLAADEKNAGKTTMEDDFDGISCSLLQLLSAVSKKWSAYSEESRQNVQAFIMNWNPYLTEDTFPIMGSGLQVGFGRMDITPSYSVPLAGYGNTHNRMSTGIQTRLYATCVALTDQYDQTLLVVSMDLINAVWHEEIRAAISAATGVPVSHIAVSATHTHAAPDPDSTLDVIQKTYKPQFMLWAAEAAAAAMADRAEAFAFSGDTRLEKMNTVRHYLMADGTYAGDNFGTFTNNTIVAPAEKADNQLQVIKFAREGKQDVVMANWQAHATLSTGSKYYKISADIVAPTRDYVEKNTDSLFVYFSGASGNINPESKIKTENITEDYWLYGELLGQAVTGVLGDMDEADITMVKAQTITFTGEIDHTGEEKLAQATEVRELYTADGLSAANKLARNYGFSNYYHAYGIVRRSKYGATRDFEISVFTLGGISFVIAPSEMFSSHGEYIKENTPGVTFVLTSANGKVNYIPNTKAYDYSCYERHAGYFTRETGDVLAQTYVDMLNRLTN